MNRVHDLPDSGWFAMKPNPSWYDDDGDEEAPAEPEVGDVLANTRTPDDPTAEYLIDGAPEWADPPFVRVVDVLSIVKYGEHRTVGRYVVVQVKEGSKRAFMLDNSPERVPLWPITAIEIDLPGAQPGGWAVRVEAYAMSTTNGTYELQPPTGRPLNEQENTR